MKQQGRKFILMLFCALICIAGLHGAKAKADSKFTCTIKKQNIGKGKLNDWYAFKYAFQDAEEAGGGVITVKKGTYNIPVSLYVPSNTTIIFEDGVVINKTKDTGTKEINATSSIFLLSPRNYPAKGYKGYNGGHDIQLIGKGKVIIDAKYIDKTLSIVMGHNKNVLIENITFQNSYNGHSIELDASKNVTIRNCTFKNAKVSKGAVMVKEAINLDIPDKLTGGFNQKFTSYDKTPNKNIYIYNNTFKNQVRAIGTHKFTKGKYHTNIVIKDNTFTNCSATAIRALNWRDFKIQNNKMTNIAKKDNFGAVIQLSGVKNFTITKNTIKDAKLFIDIRPWINSNDKTNYGTTYNTITKKNIEAMKENYVSKCKSPIIRVRPKYGSNKNMKEYKIKKSYLNKK